jgi:hypothetical protein
MLACFQSLIMTKNTKGKPGAFGGLYNHEVINNLRSELAKSRLVLAALIEHTKLTEVELQKIASDFFRRQEQALSEQNKKV